MVMTLEELYAKLDELKILQARIKISKETRYASELSRLERQYDAWLQVIEELHNRGKFAMAYILNQYYAHNETLVKIAKDLDYDKNYVSELKRNACKYLIDEKLYKLINW